MPVPSTSHPSRSPASPARRLAPLLGVTLPGVTLLGVTLLGAALPAQTYATSPKGYISTEGPGYSVYFGGFPSSRHQIFSREYTGHTVSIKAVACRRDGVRDASPYYFAGRSWANVRLTAAEDDFTKVATTFTQNLVSNVRQVFSGSVTWPDHSTGSGTSLPHSWATDVDIPFNSPWAYSGNQDIALDFQFAGGTLANNSFWSNHRPYYLDGLHAPVRAGGGSMHFGTNKCVNAPYTVAPFCVPVLYAYRKDSGDPKTDDKYTFRWWLDRYPPNAPAALALSLSGSTAGTPIGNACQNIHIGPALLYFLTTPADNSQGILAPDPPLANNYDPAAVGVGIWTQAAIQHPTRNQLEFTRGGFGTLPAQPVAPPNAKWMWAPSASSRTAAAIDAEFLPLLRFAN